MTVDDSYDGVVIELDVVYGTADGEPLLLDIARPDPMPAEPVPALVWIHGGGWMYGDKRVSGGESIGLNRVRAGYACLSINYRLSDKAIFPAQIHDAKAAIRWVRANAGRLGVDPNRIGVWGHSAGAHLSALLGTSPDVPELDGDSGSPGVSSGVQAVFAISPPTDFLAIPDGWPHAEPRFATTILVGGPLEERPELVKMANPITYVSPDAPPFLILHGENDEVVPIVQAEMLHEALAGAGVDSTFVRAPRAYHSLEAPELGITREAAWLTIGEQASAFFDRHFKVSRG